MLIFNKNCFKIYAKSKYYAIIFAKCVTSINITGGTEDEFKKKRKTRRKCHGIGN